MIQKKFRVKPLYKTFCRLKQNVQNRTKLYNFKKKKWNRLLKYLKKIQNLHKYYKYDHFLYYKYRSSFYFKTKFKLNLYTKQKLSLFYGNLTKNYIKFIVRKATKYFFINNFSKNFIHTNLYFIEQLESKIDIILYRSNFVTSIRKAKQLVSHGNVFVNKKRVKNSFYIIKKGDLITIKPDSYFILKNNYNNLENWFIPPKYLQINYKTFQIILVSDIKYTKIIHVFPFWLNINSLIKNYTL